VSATPSPASMCAWKSDEEERNTKHKTYICMMIMPRVVGVVQMLCFFSSPFLYAYPFGSFGDVRMLFGFFDKGNISSDKF
jgi:hypothetical protein